MSSEHLRILIQLCTKYSQSTYLSAMAVCEGQCAMVNLIRTYCDTLSCKKNTLIHGAEINAPGGDGDTIQVL